MKNLFILLFIASPLMLLSQVGIGTQTPQATLDIQGNLRIATRGNGQNDTKILTVNDNGVVNETVLNTIATRKYRQTLNVSPGNTNAIIFTNPNGFVDSNIIVRSSNACSRNMISNFTSSDGAVGFLGGIARDKASSSTIEAIPSSESSYSPRIIVTFANVTGCSDGGDGTQFNFSIKKLSNTEYEIRNNGNIAKTITLIWAEI
ncbi:hypothetical protein [Chishuiella changwenlii]|uniref:hypothetical protein n=1 Tax=Chishuiella changwenlii TaxID=1434701 RepID=UPI002FDAD4FC